MAESGNINFQNERQKSWVTILLLLSCITTTLLLWKVEPVTPLRLTSQSQIDSLITLTFDDLQLPSEHISTRTIQVDSVFSRGVYTIRVAPEFSKTTLHYFLQQEMWPYDVQTIAGVEFPGRDMTIHLLVNNTVQRSLFVKSDPDIEYVYQNFYSPPDQVSDEMD
ncbi:MAG: hypothetical protein WEA56_02335 [Balneolaceae bacterium]